MPRFFAVLSALLSTALAASSNVSVSISVPTSPGSSPSISGSLVSLSIEQDRWTDWAGTSSPNTFFVNVLENVKAITGVPPRIRVGADSEDHTTFDPSVQFSEANFPAITATVPYPEASNITVGQGFYDIVSHLPSGTVFTVGLNFGSDNVTNAVAEAKAIKEAFQSGAAAAAGVTLVDLEIGNEADLYNNNGLRPSNFSVTEYLPEWVEFGTNVSEAIGMTPGKAPGFWGAAFAGSSFSTTGFSPQALIADGILNTEPGKLIDTFSQHHYSGSFCAGSGGLLQDLMTKATIRSNLSEFSSDIAAVKASGKQYILGETNSYSCHGAPGVSNVAGAALWMLDYSLFATQIGIERVFFHEGIGYKYNLIQPVALNRSILDGSPLASPLPPHVQPAYYGMIIAAEALGSSGSTQVQELEVNSTEIAGYAFYEAGVVKRAVLIDSKAFLSTDTVRNSTHVQLDFASGGPSTMTIKRLAIGHADDASNLTWGGQTYETANGKVAGTLSVQTAKVSAGVDIQDTEVVLLTFQ